LGCTAMELLLNIIEDRDIETIHYIMEHELIIRESTVK